MQAATQTLRTGAPSASATSSVSSILFIAILLLAWITVKPFVSLADAKLITLDDGSDLLNQFAYVALAATVAMYFLINEPWRARPLLRPAYFAMLAWLMVSVATSNYPALSAKRFIFTAVAILLAAALPLLPTTFKRFCDLLAGATIAVLVLSYVGLVFVPELSIHQATDVIEPLLAGNWRGVFNHKNVAGPMMAMFIFIGLFIAKARNAALGWSIVVPAAIFLWFSQAKSATGLLPVVLLLSFALGRVHSRALCALMIFGVLIVLNMLTIGSTQFDAIKSFNDAVLSDPTFTGRNDIWLFSIESIKDRPWFGHGFGAFWETPATFFLPMTEGSQVASASHAHNAFLDLALTVGLPGLALAIVWTMVLPFRDLQRCKAIGAHRELTTLFVRLWLFGVYTCSFESFLFDRGNPNWFTMLVAMFGLRYLATSRLTVEADRRHVHAVATT